MRSRIMGQPNRASFAIFCQGAAVNTSREALPPIFIAGVLDSSGQARVQTRS